MQTQISGMLALPGRHWEPVGAAWSWCCMQDYIFESVKFYSLDYRSMRKGDIKEWRADSSARSLPCGVGRIGKSSGVSGGDVEGRIRVFQAQRIPVPYSASAV